MVYSEFIEKFKKENSFKRNLEKTIASLIFLVFGYFAYLILFTDWLEQTKSPTQMPKWSIWIMVILFCGISLHGLFFKIPKNYTIKKYHSQVSTDIKKKVLERIKKELKLIELESEDNYCLFLHPKNWWNTKFKIYFFYDENNFYYNSQIRELPSQIGGFLDFGKVKSHNDSLERIIKEQLRYFEGKISK